MLDTAYAFNRPARIDAQRGWPDFMPPPPEPVTSTTPAPRRIFVWFRHKQAAQALLADIFGDIPSLTAVHEAAELRGLPANARWTWVEVVDHDYVIPDVVHMAAKTAGLVHVTLSDKNARDAYSKKIRDFCRMMHPDKYTGRRNVAPDDML